MSQRHQYVITRFRKLVWGPDCEIDPLSNAFALSDYEGGRELWMERCVVTAHIFNDDFFGTYLRELAIAFGYFENLFRLRDSAKVEQELARIKSLNSLMDSVGQQEHLYDIFVDATVELLEQMSTVIGNGSHDDACIVNAFNEEYNSSAIITHFRVNPA